MYRSYGVVGWHLNDEPAAWEEFGWQDEIEDALSVEAGRTLLEERKYAIALLNQIDDIAPCMAPDPTHCRDECERLHLALAIDTFLRQVEEV